MSATDIRSIPPDDRVKKLSNPEMNFDVNTPIKRYMRSGLELLRQADSYYEVSDYERCYQYYMKYIIMFLEKIPQHPEYKTTPSKDKKEIKQNVSEVLKKAEAIKVKLKEKYQVDYQAYLVDKEQRDREVALQQKQAQAEAKRKLAERSITTPSAPALHYDRIEALDKTFAQVKQVGPLPDNIYPSFDTIMSSPSRIMSISPGGPQSLPSIPSFDRATKPASAPPPSKDYGLTDYLRPVVVPAQLMSSFLVLAQRNTDRNVETCGILAGGLVSNRNRLDRDLWYTGWETGAK
uniref:STAM-binding protein-like A n=1 Tax=Cacopsylla melanoneura TaxID=428564 RepID=A0A8D8YDL9_9HEMI